MATATAAWYQAGVEPHGDGKTGGARFFDERKQDRGWASRVTRRVRAIDGLTTLDVTTNELQLAAFLGALDRARLRVESTDAQGECYSFVWASGYENGGQIRVQGVLEGLPHPRVG
jgi:hypothetical protein